MTSDSDYIAKVLEDMAAVIRKEGFPTHPFILENGPKEPLRFWLALFRNDGDRELSVIEDKS